MTAVTVAIISDTHAHLDSRIVDVIKQCDYAIHAGDVCGQHVIDAMQPKQGKVLVVAGNNDAYCHDGKALPTSLVLELPHGSISVEHGHVHGSAKPCHDSLRHAHPNARVIVYGHTHRMVQDTEQLPWVVNPGAAGETRTHGGPSCLVLTADEKDWSIEAMRF